MAYFLSNTGCIPLPRGTASLPSTKAGMAAPPDQTLKHPGGGAFAGGVMRLPHEGNEAVGHSRSRHDIDIEFDAERDRDNAG